MISGKDQQKNSNESLEEVLEASFPTVSGPQSSLADYGGNIVMLHFFASWCRDCAAEIPSLKNLHSNFDGTTFEIVGVAVDDTPADAEAFALRHELPFPVLIDTAGDLKNYFSVRDLPTTLFLDRNGTPIRFQDPSTGRITSKLEGSRRWDTGSPVSMIGGLIETR
jgi:thiol-disulfide isomerase/thioredoxin